MNNGHFLEKTMGGETNLCFRSYDLPLRLIQLSPFQKDVLDTCIRGIRHLQPKANKGLVGSVLRVEKAKKRRRFSIRKPLERKLFLKGIAFMFHR